MKKQQKTKRNSSKIKDKDQHDTGLPQVWPPPGVDPDDKKALAAALPWNQSGGYSEPIQLLDDIEEQEDDLTREQRRENFLRTAPPQDIEWLARHELQSQVTKYRREKDFSAGSYAHTISRFHPRDTTAGIYVGASEAFHAKVANATEKAGTPDNCAINLLAEGQPWRRAIAVHPENRQSVSTYGPMQLPGSRDPLDSLETDPGPEHRPTHWEPGAPASDIIAGALHDFGNYLSALVARQVVAIGFTPDTEAIANARSLARTIKDFQKMTQIEHERQTKKPRRTSPGRPAKRTLIAPEKAVTLRLEIVERNKKFRNKKYADITIEESASEADLNTETHDQPKHSVTHQESAPEADLNATLLQKAPSPAEKPPISLKNEEIPETHE